MLGGWGDVWYKKNRESILQASTKVEFEEWKAALFYWHPPDDEIPQIESLHVSTPPTVSAYVYP